MVTAEELMHTASSWRGHAMFLADSHQGDREEEEVGRRPAQVQNGLGRVLRVLTC